MYLLKRNNLYPETMPLLLFGDMPSLLWNAGMLKQLTIFNFILKVPWPKKKKKNDTRFNPQDFRETFTAPWSPKTFEPLELVCAHQYHFICTAMPDLQMTEQISSGDAWISQRSIVLESFF